MDPTQLVDFITQRKWVAVAAIVIAFIVRILKSDTKIPINIPPQLRVWLALGLGAIAGVFDKVALDSNVTWTSALTQGLVAAVLAIVSHNVVIDSARGGKEFNVPGLIKDGVPPGPGKPPSKSPPPMPPTGPAIMMFGAFLLASCGLLTPAVVAKIELTTEEVACVIEHAFVADPVLDGICKFINPATQKPDPAKMALGHQLASSYREQAKRDAVMHAEVCAPVVEQIKSTMDGGVK